MRKAGIIPPKEPPPATPSPPSSPTLDDILDELTPSELQEISEDVGDDLERTISEYRRQRISELRQEEKKSRFGQVYPIARDDYTREVTEASKVSEVDDDEDKGTAVICFLYQDGWVELAAYFIPRVLILFQDSPESARIRARPNPCRTISANKIRFYRRFSMHTEPPGL